MAIDRLVWNCLINGTTMKENRIGVRLQPLGSERILFFQTDCEYGRPSLNLNSANPICDGIVFVRDGRAQPRLIFVEMKGNDTDHAVKQIKTTAAAVRCLMPPHITGVFDKPKMIGLVITRGSAPRSGEFKEKKELASLGVEMKFKGGVSSVIDIRNFL